MFKRFILLFLIILLAVLLRFWQLGQNPPSLTWDEAAWGYNAYSLGIDGKDEFGRFLPLDYLESFGDFKPPVYAYLDIIPIKIFGLNEFGTRFPSAFFGVLTVLITYFLVKKIFWSSSSREQYALLTSLVLAISPWHIMLSRAAFEANIATFFLISGIWLFLCGAQNRKWCVALSAISFVISIYTFNTARVVAPILVLVLCVIFRKKMLENKKQFIFAFLIGLLLLLPTIKFLFSPQASLRFKEVNIFSDVDVVKISNQEIANDNNSFLSKILHNRRVGYSLSYVKHYFDNLSPEFLFIKGDGNPKFSIQDIGQMYLWDLPFFIVGMLFLFRRKEGYWWLIPLWLIVSIIPAATARETPHALRIETALPTFQILVAYGIFVTVQYLKKSRYFRLAIAFICIALITNVLYFLHNYTIHYKSKYSGEWQYGYKDTINFVKSVEKKYDSIYVTSIMGRPYIYYLFYLKTNPQIFRGESIIERDAFGFVKINKVGKYIFINEKTKIDRSGKKKNLTIEVPENVPENVNVLKNFYLLNGEVALVAYE